MATATQCLDRAREISADLAETMSLLAQLAADLEEIKVGAELHRLPESTKAACAELEVNITMDAMASVIKGSDQVVSAMRAFFQE